MEDQQFKITKLRTCIVVTDVMAKVPVLNINTFPYITIQHAGVPSENEMVGEVLVSHLYYRLFLHDRLKKALDSLTYPVED